MLGFRKALGYQQLTSLSAVAALTVPAGATSALIIAEIQSVRWRDDGSDPTATVGMLVPTNTLMEFGGNLAAVKFIETAASAKLNVTYYA